jgi:transcriptional regulator with XRE-family HTH domain
MHATDLRAAYNRVKQNLRAVCLLFYRVLVHIAYMMFEIGIEPLSRRPTRPPGLKNLKLWRVKRGLSQITLAKLAGTTHATVSRLETGATDYKPETVRKLATALNISFEELISMSPDQEDERSEFIDLLRNATPEERRRALRILRSALDLNGTEKN